MYTGIVYKAIVKSGDRAGRNTFKERFNNHKKSLRSQKYEKETELSKYIWGLKKTKKAYTIHWEIVKESNTGMGLSGQYNLCLEEKLEILKLKGSSLNKRTELISNCRHNRKPPSRARVKKK